MCTVQIFHKFLFFCLGQMSLYIPLYIPLLKKTPAFNKDHIIVYIVTEQLVHKLRFVHIFIH